MPSKVRIGVLGCSSIAKRSVIPSILDSSHFELSAVASRSPEKGKDFARRFQCGFCSYEKLIERNDIEAVYVSLPVGLHYEWGLKTIYSGKHLLLEKTFTDSYSKAKKIIRAAKSRDLVAMEALMYVYHPLSQNIHSLVESGTIGELLQIEAFFGFPELPKDNIRHKKSLGGGAVLDVLIYPLSFCLSFKKIPHMAVSYNIVQHEKYDVDSRGFVKISWKDCVAFITYGFGFMYRNSCLVWGNKGYLSAERIFTRPPDMKSEIIITKNKNVEKINVPEADHFKLMLDDFYRKILKEDSAYLNEGQDILRRMNIISEIYEYACM